ncbi:hypothetical protein D3C78_1504950 [compost metagenome]
MLSFHHGGIATQRTASSILYLNFIMRSFRGTGEQPPTALMAVFGEMIGRVTAIEVNVVASGDRYSTLRTDRGGAGIHIMTGQ